MNLAPNDRFWPQTAVGLVNCCPAEDEPKADGRRAKLAQALDGIVENSCGVEVPLVMVAKSFAVAAVVYVVSWLGTYIVLMGGDMTYLGDYFVYSWTGGGEIPAYIQFIAATFGLVAWVVAYFRMKKAPR